MAARKVNHKAVTVRKGRPPIPAPTREEHKKLLWELDVARKLVVSLTSSVEELEQRVKELDMQRAAAEGVAYDLQQALRTQKLRSVELEASLCDAMRSYGRFALDLLLNATGRAARPMQVNEEAHGSETPRAMQRLRDVRY